MPELPEVETVVRDLRPLLVARTITGVRHSKQKLRRPWKPAWNTEVPGKRVEGVRRRGKWILIDLEEAKTPNPPCPPSLKGRGESVVVTSPSRGEVAASLWTRRVGGEASEKAEPLTPHPARKASPTSPLRGEAKAGSPLLRVHLGMTGQFTVVDASDPEPDHLHVVFALDDNKELRLRDQRRFGSAEYFLDRAAVETQMNAELGPEPFGLNAEYFRTAVQGTSRNLKALLLDQQLVAGVGNIYADEACFRARLHPGRAGKSLTLEECERLREAVEAVLTRAIGSRGSTIRDYVGGSGLRGGFQNEFAVYGRADEPCPTCQTAIASARYAGRTSHYCPTCQTPGKGARRQKTEGRKKKRAS